MTHPSPATTIPIGITENILVNGIASMIPLSTTEGALIASFSRGNKLLTQSGGVVSCAIDNGYTLSAVISLSNLEELDQFQTHLSQPSLFESLSLAVSDSNPSLCLGDVESYIVAQNVSVVFRLRHRTSSFKHIQSKLITNLLKIIKKSSPVSFTLLSIQTPFSSSSSPSVSNIVKPSGFTVSSDVVIPAQLLQTVMHVSPQTFLSLNQKKNYLGSSLACTLGGNNAHASNALSALFLACGQDMSLIPTCSACFLTTELTDSGDLHVSCTMPSLLVDVSSPLASSVQKSLITFLLSDEKNVFPPTTDSEMQEDEVIKNANKRFAMIAASVVLAGELSLISSLAQGTLMDAHNALNRGKSP
ncbi:putative 3-hydroxy-3-methylglutaryl-coenzyme A reductase 1 [Blattamonas nauphoetae]|uniref:3-hydroxy-3-methylglutaryl-coenzyme A reductase 1 n=1 Tax=Blattamonas nauphoetae TaxID=2049346 RepID=A0ABQ9YBZ9_9EUKA|nr:putative 3-hydroxy-3-methylglutaryl-coenzyme A reductase 1 [Blattamonas nauphoetae]